jgi:hypothetical protein
MLPGMATLVHRVPLTVNARMIALGSHHMMIVHAMKIVVVVMTTVASRTTATAVMTAITAMTGATVMEVVTKVVVMMMNVLVTVMMATCMIMVGAVVIFIPYVDTTCQIFFIHGHPIGDCWWRYGDDREKDGGRGNKGANFAGVDANWYYDTGATYHITSELNELSTHNNTLVKIVFTQLKAHVCILVILVIQFCAPLIIILVFMIYYMFLVHLKIFYQFIGLLLTNMSLLSFTLSSF